MASSVAAARAINVALVSAPAWCSSSNGAIDPGGQPKVVGIEDETAHRLSVSTLAAPEQEDRAVVNAAIPNKTPPPAKKRTAMMKEGRKAIATRVGG